MAKDTAPWVWQATELFDRMKEGTLTIVELAEVYHREFDLGMNYADSEIALLRKLNKEQASAIRRLRAEISRLKRDAAIGAKAQLGDST